MVFTRVREIRVQGPNVAFTREPAGVSTATLWDLPADTFERWCAQGDVPGAYRTRGGHWRVREPTKALRQKVISQFFWVQGRTVENRHCPKNWRDRVRAVIAQYPYDPPVIPFPTREDFVATRLKWAAHGITEDDFNDANLKERDPEKHRKIFEWSLSHELPTCPRTYLALKKHPLQTATYLLRLNGRKVTRAAIAHELRVSVDTLYRRYGQLAVRAVCEEPPLYVLASVGKKTPIRARSELD